MTDASTLMEDFFLEHGAKDAASIKEYNRQYYLRNRKLKGRPKRVEEDEVPMKSPTGAKLVDYDGKGSGKATYSDGSVFDGNGWAKAGSKAAAKTNVSEAQKLNSAQKRLSQARLRANQMTNPKMRDLLLRRIAIVQKRIDARKTATPATRGPDKAGRPAGHPEYGNDPPAKTKKNVPLRRSQG